MGELSMALNQHLRQNPHLVETSTAPTLDEHFADLFNLSRLLNQTNRLEQILKTIARHSLSLLQVVYCRILTLEEDGRLITRPVEMDERLPELQRRRLEHLPATLREYRQVLHSQGPVVYQAYDFVHTPLVRQNLGLNDLNSLCLVPMRVADETIGLIVLGDHWRKEEARFNEERIRLAVMIADQAAAIHRTLLNARLRESQVTAIRALVSMLEQRDLYTGDHSRRMTELAGRLARQMGCPPEEVEAVHWAAILHDLGKVGIPDETLRKPAELSAEEWKLMKTHPQKGAEIILMLSGLEHVAMLVLAHHERFDGTGYPYGLSGNRIPLGARILAVVDAYTAMTDGRVYRPAISHLEALAELRRCAGSHFDPQVVEAFLALFN